MEMVFKTLSQYGVKFAQSPITTNFWIRILRSFGVGVDVDVYKTRVFLISKTWGFPVDLLSVCIPCMDSLTSREKSSSVNYAIRISYG